MTRSEKQMILGMVILIILLSVSVVFYSFFKALEPITKNIETNGIKPYIMQLWEGKK